MHGRDFAAWLERVCPQIESSVAAHKLVNVYRDRIEQGGLDFRHRGRPVA